jgi:hypothetical protein
MTYTQSLYQKALKGDSNAKNELYHVDRRAFNSLPPPSVTSPGNYGTSVNDLARDFLDNGSREARRDLENRAAWGDPQARNILNNMPKIQETRREGETQAWRNQAQIDYRNRAEGSGGSSNPIAGTSPATSFKETQTNSASMPDLNSLDQVAKYAAHGDQQSLKKIQERARAGSTQASNLLKILNDPNSRTRLQKSLISESRAAGDSALARAEQENARSEAARKGWGSGSQGGQNQPRQLPVPPKPNFTAWGKETVAIANKLNKLWQAASTGDQNAIQAYNNAKAGMRSQAQFSKKPKPTSPAGKVGPMSRKKKPPGGGGGGGSGGNRQFRMVDGEVRVVGSDAQKNASGTKGQPQPTGMTFRPPTGEEKKDYSGMR